jgi:hypothetical protein
MLHTGQPLNRQISLVRVEFFNWGLNFSTHTR